jgi:hypothetical protein
MNLANMKRSETTEQIGLINWARANEEYVPELRLLHHIPNEVIRHYLARGEGFDLVNCEHAFKMCGYCEGVAVDWAPCEKCQFFKANKERGKK